MFALYRTDDGNCTNQLTSCNACYFANEDRQIPEKCRCDRKRYMCAERNGLKLTTKVEMKLEKCLDKWGKCVKKNFNRLYGKVWHCSSSTNFIPHYITATVND